MNTKISDAQECLVDHWVQSGMPRERALAFVVAASKRKPAMTSGENVRMVKALWCCLPYHPIWMNAILKAIRNMNKDRVLLEMSCEVWKHFRLRPSWSNFLPALECRVNGRRQVKAGGCIS